MKFGFPVSGKTGTTNKNRNPRFVCFTPDLCNSAVWVRCDTGADTGCTGATGALPVRARFLRMLYAHSAPPAFIPPESGFPATEACPQTFREACLTETAPREIRSNHPVNPVMDAVREKVIDTGGFFRKLFDKTQ